VTSVVTIAIGMALLAVSLAARYANAPDTTIVTSWVGSLLVIVGVGRVIFLT
jgi:hypothetical protein